MPVKLAHGRLRKEKCEFEDSLRYTVKHSQKTKHEYARIE
jgi:hypothetical protein